MADRFDSLKLYQDQPEEVTTADILRKYGPREPDERGMLLPISRTGNKLSLDWPSVLYEPYQSIKRLVQQPHESGYLSTSGARGPVEDSLNAAAAVAAPSLGLNFAGMAPKNAVGIFGGRLAKTADQAALARAEEMAAKGTDRRAIWDETGWFQGKDGKWRFEIPDDKAVYSPGAIDARVREQTGRSLNEVREQGVQAPLFEVLDHPEAFKAYGALGMSPWKAIPPDKMTLPGMGGVWRGPINGMEINNTISPSLSRGKSITLHELQHGLQDAEGFARGANMDMFRSLDPSQLQKSLYAIEDARFLKEQAAKRGITPEEVVPVIEELYGRKPGLDAYKRYVQYDEPDLAKWSDNFRQHIRDAADPKKAYERTAGEVEARNVQKRMDMTKEERRATPPWETEDVPSVQQILRQYGQP